MFTPIDLSTWPRREHFQYYRTAIPCGYSATVRMDVTEAVNFAKAHGLHFYPCFVYAAAKTVNERDEMRMMLAPDGAPGIWDVSHPCFTVFHSDDHTFSDLWTEHSEDFSQFYQNFLADQAAYGDHHGIKAKPGQPANFYCISCAPWLDFTGYASTVSGGQPNLFPVITCGQMVREGDKVRMAMAINISHAAADGWHTAQFVRDLQALLDTIPLHLEPR